MTVTMKKIAALFIATLFAASSYADPLFDNGTASSYNGYAIGGAVNQSAEMTADDFRLSASAQIRRRLLLQQLQRHR